MDSDSPATVPQSTLLYISPYTLWQCNNKCFLLCPSITNGSNCKWGTQAKWWLRHTSKSAVRWHMWELWYLPTHSTPGHLTYTYIYVWGGKQFTWKHTNGYFTSDTRRINIRWVLAIAQISWLLTSVSELLSWACISQPVHPVFPSAHILCLTHR